MQCSTTITSPIGPITLTANEHGLCEVRIEQGNGNTPGAATENSTEPALGEAARQFRAYFAGELQHFELALDTRPGTPFQQRVWAALRTINFGTTASYRDIAKQIGAPNAVRAVGAANGRNPLAIIVPCHRIIGADGSLTGYAGGLDNKRWLLAHEAKHSKNDLLFSAAN